MGEAATHLFDHLVLGISDLALGIDRLAKLTGVTAVAGGEHPRLGTHNALASLGPHSYLEIVAPRPGAATGESRFVRLSRRLQRLTPILWAVATSDSRATRSCLAAAGFETSEPDGGERRTPDGGVIEWRTFDVLEPSLETAPFFIEWARSSVHPATTSPAGCSLTRLELVGDDGARIGRLLEVLGLDVTIAAGPRPGLRAVLTGPGGRVELGPVAA